MNNINYFLSSFYSWSVEGSLYKMWRRGKVLAIWHLFMFNLKVFSVLYSHYPTLWWSLFSKWDSFDSQASYILFLQAKISIFTASFRKLEFLSSAILSTDFFKVLITWQKKNILAVKTDKNVYLWRLQEGAEPLLLTYCFLL